MSETLGRIKESDLPTNLSKTYSEVSVEKTDGGDIGVYGLSKKGLKRPLTEERLLKEYGHPESIEAFRAFQKDPDKWLREERNDYLKNQRIYSLELPTSSGEIKDLREKVDSLMERMGELESQIGTLNSELQTVRTENSRLLEENERLTQANLRLREDNRRLLEAAKNTPGNAKAPGELNETPQKTYYAALIDYWEPREGQEVPLEVEAEGGEKSLEHARVVGYDSRDDSVIIIDDESQEHRVPKYQVATWIAREKAPINEVEVKERWIDTNRGRAIGAVAVMGVALVSGIIGYNLKDDKVIEKESSELIIATRDLVEEENEQNGIEQNQLTELKEGNEIARQRLRAERYANRLQEKENQLRLQQLRAQQYANRLEREEAERDKNTLRASQGQANDGEANGVSDSITIESGHGFTHELQDIFPGYSGNQYYQAHLAAVDKFGENYVSNVPKYKTRSGDIRFGRPGEALIRPSVRNYIESYLKSH